MFFFTPVGGHEEEILEPTTEKNGHVIYVRLLLLAHVSWSMNGMVAVRISRISNVHRNSESWFGLQIEILGEKYERTSSNIQVFTQRNISQTIVRTLKRKLGAKIEKLQTKNKSIIICRGILLQDCGRDETQSQSMISRKMLANFPNGLVGLFVTDWLSPAGKCEV